MAKTLLVEIIAEGAKYGRELKVAAAETEAFGSKAAKAGAVVGKAFLATGAVVAGVSALVGYHSVKLAAEAQQTGARLDTAFKNAGVAMKADGAGVEELEKAGRKLGFTNEETKAGLTKLIQAGKGWSGSTKEIVVAQNLARASGQGLADATSGLIRLQAGNVRAAKQYGIVLAPVTRNVDKLKASKIDLTTAAGKEALAHARVQDKLATGQAYYDALQKKVAGQGDTFSKTAAGGMAQFHAQMENLEENIGAKLIPGLTNILNWTNQHWPQIEAAVMGAVKGIGFAINQVAVPAIKFLIEYTKVAVNFIREHWDQIRSSTLEAFNQVKAVIMGAVGVVLALWRRFGDQIMSQLRAVWDFVKNYIQAALQVVKGIINVVMGLIHGDWGRAWQGIKQIFSGVWQALQAELRLAWATFKNVLEAGLKALLLFWRGEWELLKAVVGRAWQGVVALLGAARDSLVGAGHAVIAGFKRGIDSAWQAVLHFFSSAKSAMFNALGKVGDLLYGAGWALINGLKRGAEAAWNGVKNFLGGAAHTAKRIVTLGLAGSPELFTYYLGKQLVEDLRRGMQEAGGSNPVGTKFASDIKGGTIKGLGNAAGAIIAAARKVGVDARAALAVAMTEGGTSFGAVGDKGTSFGPFQLHIGGASPFSDPGKAAAFANSIQGITYALRQMAAAGAAGKSGFDAISAIVRSFERPANPSAEVAKALSYYKEIPAQLGGALVQAGGMTAAQVKRTLVQIGQLVKTYGQQIGLEHARSIVAGLVQGTPSLVQQARAALAQAAAAQRQQIAEDRAGVVAAFRSTAQAALSAFDEMASNWKPPPNSAAAKLAKMQAQDQIQGAVDAVAQAQTAIDQAVAAQANLSRNEGESDADFAARQQAAADAVTTAVAELGKAQRAQTELNLQLQAAQDQENHDKQMAADREHFAARLLQIQTELKKHPEAYAKAQRDLLKLMKQYHIPMYKAGQMLASKFSDGLDEGIASVVAAARKLANALEAIPGVTKPSGGGGVTPGTAIGGGHGAGIPPGGARTSNMNVSLTVNAATDDPRGLALQVRDELRRIGRNNGYDPLAV